MTAAPAFAPTRETKRGTVRTARGFCEIGIWHSKTPDNLGTLWRSAFQLGACGVFTIGRRYQRQPSDTARVERHLPLRDFTDFAAFSDSLPRDAALIAVEMGGRPLWTFRHPERAVYLLGAEDVGLPPDVIQHCDHVVSLESARTNSFNVAVAGSIVLYHRLMQRGVSE